MAPISSDRRNFGIDILRCLSMFFVIILHILGQGGILEHSSLLSGKYVILSFLQILSYCAVDVYGITTGYLMCRKPFRLSRLVSIWLTTVFWSVAVSCVFFLFVPEKRTIEECISMFLPILRGRYWFFTAYFVVTLLSPVLNHVIRTINRRKFRLLLAALFLIFGFIPVGSLGYDVMRISGGNHFSWMIALYLIGGYIRTHIREPSACERKASGKWLLYYLTAAAIHLLYKVLVSLIGLPGYGSLLLTNVSPLIVAEAIFLFLYFRDLGAGISSTGLTAKFLRFTAPGVYAVYIIHVHPLVFWSRDLISLLRPWDSWSTLTVLTAVLAASVTVFFVCILLDVLRQKLFTLLHADDAVRKLSRQAEQTIRAILN